MRIGQRVKYSMYALQSKWDYWQQCGREPYKSNAKRAYEAAQAIRGTVTAITSSRYAPVVLEVIEDDNGAVHQSLPYLWTNA